MFVFTMAVYGITGAAYMLDYLSKSQISEDIKTIAEKLCNQQEQADKYRAIIDKLKDSFENLDESDLDFLGIELENEKRISEEELKED